MILIAIIVVALLGVVVLACLALCWGEPVRRGGTIDFTDRRRRP